MSRVGDVGASIGCAVTAQAIDPHPEHMCRVLDQALGKLGRSY